MDGDGRGWGEAGWRGAGMDDGGRGWDGAGWRGWGEDKAGRRRRWVHGLEKEERGEKRKEKKLIPLTCGSHV